MRGYATAPMVHYARRFCGGPCEVCGVAMNPGRRLRRFLSGNFRWDQVGQSTVLANDSLCTTYSVGEGKRTFRNIEKDLQ